MSWREFTGTTELIGEGDEEKHRDCKAWFQVAPSDIGRTPSDMPNYQFRTRRPLPDHIVLNHEMPPQEWWNTQGLRRFVPGESFEDSMKWAYSQGQKSR